jgi:hypothetical protein
MTTHPSQKRTSVELHWNRRHQVSLGLDAAARTSAGMLMRYVEAVAVAVPKGAIASLENPSEVLDALLPGIGGLRSAHRVRHMPDEGDC